MLLLKKMMLFGVCAQARRGGTVATRSEWVSPPLPAHSLSVPKPLSFVAASTQQPHVRTVQTGAPTQPPPSLGKVKVRFRLNPALPGGVSLGASQSRSEVPHSVRTQNTMRTARGMSISKKAVVRRCSTWAELRSGCNWTQRFRACLPSPRNSRHARPVAGDVLGAGHAAPVDDVDQLQGAAWQVAAGRCRRPRCTRVVTRPVAPGRQRWRHHRPPPTAYCRGGSGASIHDITAASPPRHESVTGAVCKGVGVCACCVGCREGCPDGGVGPGRIPIAAQCGDYVPVPVSPVRDGVSRELCIRPEGCTCQMVIMGPVVAPQQEHPMHHEPGERHLTPKSEVLQHPFSTLFTGENRLLTGAPSSGHERSPACPRAPDLTLPVAHAHAHSQPTKRGRTQATTHGPTRPPRRSRRRACEQTPRRQHGTVRRTCLHPHITRGLGREADPALRCSRPRRTCVRTTPVERRLLRHRVTSFVGGGNARPGRGRCEAVRTTGADARGVSPPPWGWC